MKNLFMFLLLFAFFSSCSRNEKAEHSHGGEEGEVPTNRVEIPSTVRDNLGITFAQVERRIVETTIRVPGFFELRPRATMEYRPLMPGQVEFAVDELEFVEPGTVLYRFRSPELLELLSEIDVARASLEHARLHSETVEERLAALEAAAFKRADLQSESDDLKAEIAKSETELEASLNRAARILNFHGSLEADSLTPQKLLAEVEIDGEQMPYYRSIDAFEVRASEKGYVDSFAVTNGAYVEEATLLLTTIDPENVRFRALGMQADLPIFTKAETARVVPPQASGADINLSVEASFQLGLSADPEARSVTLIAEPEKILPWIRPGVSAFLEVAEESTSGFVLAIPRSAVVKDGITHVFFKRDPDNANKAIRVEADLGVDDGRWIEVRSGVGPNDEVILDGAYELKLATAQSGTAQKGGHFHADGTFHADDH
ncbi:MAG: hypothetical protein AAF733_00280 [Verrucomicrobiota bacterium]